PAVQRLERRLARRPTQEHSSTQFVHAVVGGVLLPGRPGWGRTRAATPHRWRVAGPVWPERFGRLGHRGFRPYPRSHSERPVEHHAFHSRVPPVPPWWKSAPRRATGSPRGAERSHVSLDSAE